MRVKFVTTYPPANCGIATYSEYYVRALKRLCDVAVIPIERPKINPLYFLGLIRKSRKDTDIVHVQFDCGFYGTAAIGPLSLSGMYAPAYYIFTRMLGGPSIVTTIHELPDVEKTYGGRLLYWPMKLYYTTIYRSLVALSDAVLVHTQGTIDILSQYSQTGRVEIVPHACFIVPVMLSPDECRSRLGLNGKKVVTMFGFVSPFKGHDMAIEAMKSMPGDVVLFIAGDGRTPEDREYVSALKMKVDNMGLNDRVIFHGYVKDEDSPAVMCASDLILMPYRHVVQSGAMNFALAYLKPVLASGMGGFAEVAGQYGCVETFRPGDMGDMAEKLKALLSDAKKTDSLREKAYAYREDVSIESIAGKIVKIYERILRKRSG
mgnify:CR=1 FL=1